MCRAHGGTSKEFTNSKLLQTELPNINGNWKDNFWKVNPEFELISAYAHLKNKIGDERSGKLMWYLVYMYHHSAALADLGEEQRSVELLETLGIKATDLNLALFKEAATCYKSTQISRPQRVLNAIRRKWDDIEKFIEEKEISGSKDVADLVDTMKHFDTLQKDLGKREGEFEEQQSMMKRGDKPLSALDSGVLN